MLSIFPDLLTYNLLGITIVRVVLGLVGVYLGFKILSKKNEFDDFIKSLGIPFSIFATWVLIILFVISGGLLILGLYTQAACLILAYALLKLMIIEFWSRDLIGNRPLFYLSFILISISLLFLGPGVLAFDLPF